MQTSPYNGVGSLMLLSFRGPMISVLSHHRLPAHVHVLLTALWCAFMTRPLLACPQEPVSQMVADISQRVAMPAGRLSRNTFK